MTKFDLARYRSERHVASHQIFFQCISWWTGDEFGPVSLVSNAVVIEIYKEFDSLYYAITYLKNSKKSNFLFPTQKTFSISNTNAEFSKMSLFVRSKILTPKNKNKQTKNERNPKYIKQQFYQKTKINLIWICSFTRSHCQLFSLFGHVKTHFIFFFIVVLYHTISQHFPLLEKIFKLLKSINVGFRFSVFFLSAAVQGR